MEIDMLAENHLWFDSNNHNSSSFIFIFFPLWRAALTGRSISKFCTSHFWLLSDELLFKQLLKSENFILYFKERDTFTIMYSQIVLFHDLIEPVPTWKVNLMFEFYPAGFTLLH